MLRINLYRSIFIVLLFAMLQFGHMVNQYYFICVYAFITGILSLLAYEYKGRGLIHQILCLGLICSFNPLVKEILGVGTKVFTTDYFFGYGSLIVLILLITNTINKDAK